MLDGVSHHLDGYDETLLSIGRCLAENREFQGGQKGKPRILGAVPLISFGFLWFPVISFRFPLVSFPLVSFVWIGDADSWGLILRQSRLQGWESHFAEGISFDYYNMNKAQSLQPV